MRLRRYPSDCHAPILDRNRMLDARDEMRRVQSGPHRQRRCRGRTPASESRARATWAVNWQTACPLQRDTVFPDGDLALVVELVASGLARRDSDDLVKKLIRKCVARFTRQRPPSIKVDPMRFCRGKRAVRTDLQC